MTSPQFASISRRCCSPISARPIADLVEHSARTKILQTGARLAKRGALSLWKHFEERREVLSAIEAEN
ncbi:MAG: hypothetical protein ACR2RF_14470 [Geminicoccaceae bacterium]